MYASLCDFACIALLYPFILGFCLSVDFSFSRIVFIVVIIGGFLYWFGCSLLSFFLFFLFYYFLISVFLIIFFILLTFLKFYLLFLFFSLFF